MPQINRIRVNNVKYNFGTQFYDDFVMRFSCRNTIYDLANGGGKSVLMLLLLQNLIPNSTLDEKQPVEKLFRTGSGSNTIHSLIEWKLDPVNIKNNYKYMLTGFCARRAREDEAQELQDNASIEYFNYCIFYREFNDNDLKNLPLSNGRERITYNGLKSYLRELEKKDFSLEIKIFDRKGEYQRFISQFGLYESQWEIIRGINKTEGHVRTYFENNYKTTRKVVEDLLIEEIIEKSFKTRVAAGDNDSSMAKTLLDIKDKLIELSRRKEDINSYDMQIEAIESFIGRISGMRQMYFGREDLEEQVVKSYNTLNRIMLEREDKLEEYKAEQQAVSLEKKVLSQRLETIKVQKLKASMKELNFIIKGLTERLVSVRTGYESKKSGLLMMEGENDYLDYLYYKGERDALKTVIDNLSANDGNADRNNARLCLGAIGNEKKKRNSVRKEELSSLIEKENAALEKETELISENQAREIKLVQDISVAEYLVENFTNRLQELNKKIYKEKESLGLIMNVDIQAEADKCMSEMDGIKAELEKLSEDLIRSSKNRMETDGEYHTKELNQRAVEETIAGLINEKAGLESLKTRLVKMEELYGEKNIDSLLKTTGEQYREVIGDIKGAGEEISALKLYNKNLEKGCPVGSSAEVINVLAYIEKYHGDVAVAGSEYVSQMPLSQREQILSRVPIMPYSIIIKSEYNTIAADRGLKRILTGDYAVPLIREEALNSGEYLFDMSGVSFVMRDDSLFTDGEALEREKARTAQYLRDLEDKKVRLDELEEILRSDYDFIKEYRDVYSDKIARNDRLYEDNKLLRKQLETELAAMDERRVEMYQAEEGLREKENKLKSELKGLEEKIEALDIVINTIREAAGLEREIGQFRSKKEALKKEQSDVTAKIRAEKDSLDYRRSHISVMYSELREMDSIWNTLYKEYYSHMEDISSFGLEKLSDDELDSKAKGLREVIEGGLTDIQDKRKLMDNYDIAMEKSLQAIDYKGISLDKIKENYQRGAVKHHTKDELISFKRLMDGIEQTIRQLSDEAAKNRTSRDKLEGAVTHGIQGIEEKYGSYYEHDVELSDLDRMADETEKLINNLEQTAKNDEDKIREIEADSKDYIIYKRDLDKIMENANITNVSEANVWDENIDFREKLSVVSERYEKYKKEIQSKKEELERDKNILADTLNALSAFQLAREIRDNVLMPSTISETEMLMESLREIISCIQLEKERIGKNIEDMERIKDNFENQCIQSCVNIRTELERLEKLSKIYMNDEAISIIGLNVPYVKEEAYKPHMSAYIDEIVQSADGLRNEDERIKYIKNQLSWKKLFSVIVTDMNGIKLTLYKRERIKEQSRYLRYEEAVGSTGQSQGIYIQFLIGIINYITSINSGNTESRSLGKVVFIDNPFGAAKDVYIWEPIFKMLKTNNVQLIVPCRGATPAITGRFDVNYILGQKMTDGKQQTVVVEYYSNVESNSVEYEKLSFEQNKLTFE